MIQIYKNGNVFTAKERFERCQAFAVENGRFVRTGTDEEVLAEFQGREKETEVIDLEGKMVVPGFNDSHIHLLNYAYSLTKLHLEGLNSVEEIVEAARTGAMEECFGTGTAAVVSPVGELRYENEKMVITGGKIGPLTPEKSTIPLQASS
mgnify:CR=1 FL=1